MRAEIITEHGFEKYFAIKITGLPKATINGRKEIFLRVSQSDYNNDTDMFSLFNEIVDRINKGDT